ncbi:MAG: GNAT family N-acetyltransferase [Pseudomonadota bacterium]
MTPAFLVRPARWAEDAAAIARVRRAVFITEQGVPEDLEWEAMDPDCLWFVAAEPATAPTGDLLGVCRLTPRGRVGRMAVLAPWRRQGLGSALLEAALAAARARGQSRVELSAQTRAMGFYARHGFVARGPEYDDAGIPHRTMILDWKDHP